MGVPNAVHAAIDPKKLREYLLSTTHPVGRFKAAYFGSLGFSRDSLEELETCLRRHLETAAETKAEMTPFGLKYIVRGMIAGPSGRETELVSVWIVLSGEAIPRFVTAYPGDGR